MKEIADYKFELLKQEIDAVQKGIDIYNRTIFAVKGLAMTLFTAFIALVGSKNFALPNKLIFLAMAIILLLFWILDAIFKSIQKVYIARSMEIEMEIRKPGFYQLLAEDSPENFNFPGIEHAFEKWQNGQFASAFAMFWQPTVFLVYASMIILDIVIGLSF